MCKQLIEIIKKHFGVFLTAVVLVAAAEWVVLLTISNAQMEVLQKHIALLREQVDVLTEQKASLEIKLRQPAPLLEQTPQHELQEPVNTPPVSNLSRFPHIADSARPSKEEVRKLARFYDLFNHWQVNSHLQFKEGDISYWSGRGLTEQELMREFESRQTVLRRAETSGEKIPSQGDLSYKAEQLQAISRTR